VGHSGAGEWTGGTPYRGLAARSPDTYALGFTILRTPKCRWSEGPLKGQPHSVSGFRRIEIRESGRQAARHHEC
jgi:hypothetical protein